MDACDAVAKEDGTERIGVPRRADAPARASTGGRTARQRSEEEDGDVDDLIDDADVEGDDLGYGRDNEGVGVDDDY